MTVEITPLRTFCLVQPVASPERSTIITVFERDDVPQRGRILKIGDEVKDLAVGQTILYNRTVAIEVAGELILLPEAGAYLVIAE